MTPLREAIRRRIMFDTYGRPGDSLTQVTINPRETAAVDAAGRWEVARRDAIRAGTPERDLLRAATKMVQLHRAVIAVWTEIGGPVPSGSSALQARFRSTKAAAVKYAQSLGFTSVEGELLATMRPNR